MDKTTKNEFATSVTDFVKRQCDYIKRIEKNQHQKPVQLVFQDLLYSKRKGGTNDL